MLLLIELRTTARAHLRDARILEAKQSYNGVVYLCGYAVEIALKYRVCRTLKWLGFPSTASEFQNYRSLQTHNLETLLAFTGVVSKIKPALTNEWYTLSEWNPEIRYNRVGTKTQAEAKKMIQATQTLLRILL